MDLRNVIFAIALSFAVLFGWSVIFETPQIEKQKELEQVQTKNEDSSTPSVNLVDTKNSVISREEAVKASARVIFENENVKGSISLVRSGVYSKIHDLVLARPDDIAVLDGL